MRVKEMNRRDFLKRSLAVVAVPSVTGGLVGAGSSGDDVEKRKVPSTALQYIFDVWDAGDKVRVGGWNDEGLWSFYHDKGTGAVTSGLFHDYRSIVFGKYDDKKRTLAELRAECVSWKEINRVHHEGFSWNPGYRVLSGEELSAV